MIVTASTETEVDIAMDQLSMRSEAAIETGSEAFISAALEVDGEVVEVAAGVWVIHGRWPYEGDVILAEFSTLAEAHSVLRHLHVASGSEEAPRP